MVRVVMEKILTHLKMLNILSHLLWSWLVFTTFCLLFFILLFLCFSRLKS